MSVRPLAGEGGGRKRLAPESPRRKNEIIRRSYQTSAKCQISFPLPPSPSAAAKKDILFSAARARRQRWSGGRGRGDDGKGGKAKGK